PSRIPFDEKVVISILEEDVSFGEQLQKMKVESRRRAGLPPLPEPQFKGRMLETYALFEKYGLPRRELFSYYGELLSRGIPSSEDTARTPKTMKLNAMIESGDWVGVHEFIVARLEKNAQDIPALLIRFDLHY